MAAIPVGARIKILGLHGWSPGFLRIFSHHLATQSIRKVFPTPPPPAIKLNN